MRKKVMMAGAILLMALPLQAEEPPATLPKEFLAQLPLLMNLSDQEFENLLATTQQQNEKPESAIQTGREKDDEN